MRGSIAPPRYAQIALDIALRITRGDLKVDSKIYGRSILSSEYGVSPETIRRALKQLEDMEILEIRQNSGAVILSAEKAARYVARFNEQSDLRSIQNKLKQLIAEHAAMGNQIEETAQLLMRSNKNISRSQPFTNYEAVIPEGSYIAGKNLNEINFWQQTFATIIAVRRDDTIILSPGPYMQLQTGDTIIFVGDISTVEAVTNFIAPVSI